MSSLVCKGITKRYAKQCAVDRVDLEIERGKIYGLIGRNGAGKTTLLSLLANHTPATEGVVTLDGTDIWENRDATRHIYFAREMAAMIAGNTMVGSCSVEEYLRYARPYFAGWNRELEEKLIADFELDPKKKIRKQSKGMSSMVSIVLALCCGADFTFMDEPTSGLDVVAREKFYAALVEEQAESGRTFVLSTHIIDEATDLMEEVIILDHGRVLCKQNTRELVGNTYRVSGKTENVEKATRGLSCRQALTVGTQKAVTVYLPEGADSLGDCDVTVQPLTLQQIFVALCGEREEEKPS